MYDILALNNDDLIMYTKEIYPVEFTLNKANTNNDHCPFLDLDTYIINQLTGSLIHKCMIKEMIFHFLSLIIHF